MYEMQSRTLAACDTGYWIKTPTGGGYPFYAVRLLLLLLLLSI